MKYSWVFTILLFWAGRTVAQRSIYDSSFHLITLSGNQYELKSCLGKKLMIVLMPSTHTKTDSSFLSKLDTICRNHSDRLVIIGVLSYEDGYGDSLLTRFQAWYGARSRPNLIFTGGMYTHASSGSLQSPLFRWLTDAGRNGHFNIGVQGSGQRFLINVRGSLYAVLSPASGFSIRTLQKLLQ